VTSPLSRLDLRGRFPHILAAYTRIKEPRVTRLFHFGIYVITMVGGLVAFLNLPQNLIKLVGTFGVTTFGVFGFIGSLMCVISVVPGIMWLERVGILLLFTAVVMYGVMMLASPGVSVALFFAGALGLSLIQRLVEIRE
jgi:hypothetical protein